MARTIIMDDGVQAVLHDDGRISRESWAASGQWKVTGAVTRNNFGQVTRRWTLADILADPAAIPWKHANGKQRTYITDLDHGTPREWGNGCTVR